MKAAMLLEPSRIEIYEATVERAASRHVMLSLLVSTGFPLDTIAAALRPGGAPRTPTLPIHV